MTTLAVPLRDDEAERLAREAERLCVRVEELAAAQIRDLLLPRDSRFEDAAKYVLQKNHELYRRLA